MKKHCLLWLIFLVISPAVWCQELLVYVKFSHLTYQEVIMKLSKEFYEGNEEYLSYMTDRYL